MRGQVADGADSIHIWKRDQQSITGKRKEVSCSTLIERVAYNSMFNFMAWQRLVGDGLLIVEASRSLSESGRLMSPTQRPLRDISQHSKETDVHGPAGFEPAIPASGKQAAVHKLLRPHGHWDRAKTLSLRKLSFCEGWHKNSRAFEEHCTKFTTSIIRGKFSGELREY